MAIEVQPSGMACGATVRGINLRAPLRTRDIEALRAAWLDHLVLAFPDQELDDDALERVTLAFGPFGEDPFIAPVPGRQHVLAIERRADEATPLFAEVWHSDWSFLEVPPAATLLHGRVIPPVGGDTLFANQYAAYDALDDTMKQRLQGLRGIHSAARGYAKDGLYGEKDIGRSMAIRPSDDAKQSRTHPFVHTHPETGRKCLFVNMGYTTGIEGLPADEAHDLLLAIFRHQAEERFQYRHHWSTNMLVIWDNRCVTHKATGGYDGHARLLHRTTVAGP